MKAQKYLEKLLASKEKTVKREHSTLFREFTQESEIQEAVEKIVEIQDTLMKKWQLIERHNDIQALQFPLPNGTIDKEYKVYLNFKNLGLTDLIDERFEGLEELGLSFNKIEDSIEGIPNQSGVLNFRFLYKIDGEGLSDPMREKALSIIVNPDPKSLWKNLPSDTENPFWKEDDVNTAQSFGDKKIVVSSKRGRSHANVGSFRDDDFAIKHFDDSGWSIVAVSDGAGSYSLSRMGSKIACEAVIDFFEENNNDENSKELEKKLIEYNETPDEELHKEIQNLGKNRMYKATLAVHNKLKLESEKTFTEMPHLFANPKARTSLDYYHATLIFTAFKKFDFGYVVLTFGVGDCPIAVMNTDRTETKLMNWLDVGEFGGGTRFITQPEIFHSQSMPMATRFNVDIIKDFSFLFLMTDGIYDPKFVVEANLEKHEKWLAFVADLEGENEDGSAVDFSPENEAIADQLSTWMDFWSSGNHDDRTLAIIY